MPSAPSSSQGRGETDDASIESAYGTALPLFLAVILVALLIYSYQRFRRRFYPAAGAANQRYTPLSTRDFEQMVGGVFNENDEEDDEYEEELFGIGGSSGVEMTQRKGKAKESPAVVRGADVGEGTGGRRSQASIDFEAEFAQMEKEQVFED